MSVWAVRGGTAVGSIQRPQDRTDRLVQDPRRRHRLTRSASRDSQRAHQLPDRTLQVACEGPPFAPRPAHARRQTPPAARLPENEGRPALLGPDQETEHPQVTETNSDL